MGLAVNNHFVIDNITGKNGLLPETAAIKVKDDESLIRPIIDELIFNVRKYLAYKYSTRPRYLVLTPHTWDKLYEEVCTKSDNSIYDLVHYESYQGLDILIKGRRSIKTNDHYIEVLP